MMLPHPWVTEVSFQAVVCPHDSFRPQQSNLNEVRKSAVFATVFNALVLPPPLGTFVAMRTLVPFGSVQLD